MPINRVRYGEGEVGEPPVPHRREAVTDHTAAAANVGRVLMVMESLYPPESGGTESQVRTLCRHMRQRRVPAHVVVPMVRYGPQVAATTVDGTPVTRLGYPHMSGVGSLVMLWRLAALLIRERRHYDAIHTHIAHHMSAVTSVVGRWLGKPVVVKVAGGHEMSHGLLDPDNRSLYVRTLRRMLRQATYLQATSTDTARRLAACGFAPERIRHVPNAVDVERFQPADGTGRGRDRLPLRCRRVGVFVGRLVPEKWLDGLLTAWDRVVAPDEDVGLVVVGDGQEREALERRVRELGREDQIAFVGATRDVGPYLRAADFGVLPSLVEGLSNTLLEYLATGLPVLGSRVSGTEDLIEEGRNGWLFPAGDVDAAARALRRLIDADTDTLSAMGGCSRARIEAVAGVDAVLERLFELYGIDGAAATAHPARRVEGGR